MDQLQKGCSRAEIDAFVDQTIPQMTLTEKVGLMTGQASFFRLVWDVYVLKHYNRAAYPTRAVKRLGLPNMRFSDGPRGVVMGSSTCFPVSMARGASFDRGLEERIGAAIAQEIRARGANYYGGVCINLLRHPAWGRAQETYGEDPYHLGEMGAALVRGVQKHNVIACVKHFACNSMENMRFKVNVKAAPRTLREVYLPHFKRCLDEGAGSVMGAYNKVNGHQCCESQELLQQILRKEWGFQGFVISDFAFGIYDTVKAANNGMEVEMPSPAKYGARLAKAVQQGKVQPAVIDSAVRNILRTLLWFETRPDPQPYPAEIVLSQANIQLAQEAAEKSMVLLKNEGVLPLQRTKLKRILLVGELGTVKNIGDHGSSQVHPPYVVTPLQGLQKELPEAEIQYFDGKDLAAAKAAAQNADAVVIVAGCRHSDEGEYLSEMSKIGGDRASLRLRPDEADMIQTLGRVNPNTAVVLIGGSAIMVSEWEPQAPAILMAFYSGMQGGSALARVLLGDVNPSGKLPFSVAQAEADYPPFDRFSAEVDYGYYHGYTLLEKTGKAAQYAFGYGLSFTNFSYSQPSVKVDGKTAQISVKVRNSGKRQGAEVVQLYVGGTGSTVDRPFRLLRGFEKVDLALGEEREITFSLPKSAMAVYDETAAAWVEEDLDYTAWVGSSSRKEDLIPLQFRYNG